MNHPIQIMPDAVIETTTFSIIETVTHFSVEAGGKFLFIVERATGCVELHNHVPVGVVPGGHDNKITRDEVTAYFQSWKSDRWRHINHHLQICRGCNDRKTKDMILRIGE